MADSYNTDSLKNFDWNVYEEDESKKEINNHYDTISEFKQGVAIVSKNNKYGAIMIGNKEIIRPIYESLSEFNEGYAKARYSSKGCDDSNIVERIINISGQVAVYQGDKVVFLPSEYEWGFDFKNKICVVVKGGLYGVINKSFSMLHKCRYSSFENFVNGYAILKSETYSVIIDENGDICYRIAKLFDDGFKIITANINEDEEYIDDTAIYGMMNSRMEIIIPLSYSDIFRLNNGLFVAVTNDEMMLLVNPSNGELLLDNAVNRIFDIGEGYFGTFVDNKNYRVKEPTTCVYRLPKDLIISIPSKVCVEIDENKMLTFNLNNFKYNCDSMGNLYVIAKKYRRYGYSGWNYEWKSITKRKICHTYLLYAHSPYSSNYEIIENSTYLKGISDMEGNVIIEPQYCEILQFNDELLIAALPSEKDDTLLFGVVDIKNGVQIPFIYKCLLPINDQYIAFTNDKSYSRRTYNFQEFILPRLDRVDVKIKYGIINCSAHRVVNPMFHSIKSVGRHPYFIISKVISFQNTFDYQVSYGVVDDEGNIIIPSRYKSIDYCKEQDCYITHLHDSTFEVGVCKNLSNTVSLNGCIISKDENEMDVEVPTTIVNWCGIFSKEGIASVIKNGIKGHLNKFMHFVSYIDGKPVVMPKEYDYSCDFINGFAPVSKYEKFGIVDTNLKLLIPCEYDYIEPLTKHYFKFRESGRWGVVDISNNVSIKAKYISIDSISEFVFKIEEAIGNRSCTQSYFGLIDKNDSVIIPAQYDSIVPVKHGIDVCYIVRHLGRYGVYDMNGILIIPVIYSNVDFHEDYFQCKINDIEKHYSIKGELRLDLNSNISINIPAEYDLAYYLGLGVIKVLKNGRWGLINTACDVIIEPQFTKIVNLTGQLVIVGNSSVEGEDTFMENNHFIAGLKYGIVDLTGTIVLPIEYTYITNWENDCIFARQGDNTQIFTPCLHELVSGNNIVCRNLKNQYIIIEERNNNQIYMIDYHGDIIIPKKDYDDRQKISLLNNEIIKISFKHFETFFIRILDKKGKILFEKDDCVDITHFCDGLLLIKRIFGCNLITLQGRELFNRDFRNIQILEKGYFLLESDTCYGLADHTGKILANPWYSNKLKFENGISKISVSKCTFNQRLNTKGQVIVSDGDGCDIMLPAEYYWGTNFIKGICIVRSKKENRIGVIDEKGTVIMSPQFTQISLLSDNTLRVQNDNLWGIFDIAGKCILPAIFTTIEYVAKNRLRLVWNLTVAKSWQNGQYIPSDYNGNISNQDYSVNERSALCDTFGTILNEKQYLYVGKFVNGYACVYRNIIIENNQIKYCQVGVVDINGNTVVPADYDFIALYDHSYAKLRRGEVYGIANLKTNSISMLNHIKVIKSSSVDSYGRFVFIDGNASDGNRELYSRKIGVVKFDRVIVSPGKYSHIDLLNNGLIQVSNEDNTAFGLLGIDGKIVIPMRYSFISIFVSGFASICLGGHNDQSSWPIDHVGGKWGIIDDTGHFILECIYDEKQALPINRNFTNVKEDSSEQCVPETICFDYVPKHYDEISSSDQYGYSYYDECNNKYGGYNGYDDDTIDDAFEGDPELTWNID